MSTIVIAVMASLCVLPNDGAAGPSPSASAMAPQHRSAAELHGAVQESLRRWARRDDSSADRAAHELLELYAEVGGHPTLARECRNALSARLRSRLAGLAQQIAVRDAKTVRVPNGNQPWLAQGGGPGAQLAPGGNQGNDAGAYVGSDLAEVIRRTIAPSTWDVNGGQGVIVLWRPGNALVIRQSQEVHAQVGQLLNALGR